MALYIKGTLIKKQYKFSVISRSVLRRIKILPTQVVEKLETHISCAMNFFFRKSCHLRDNVEIYSTAGPTTDDNMAPAHCMTDTYGYQ
jgi:hypothetical protein